MEWTLWPYMLGLYKYTIVVYICVARDSRNRNAFNINNGIILVI